MAGPELRHGDDRLVTVFGGSGFVGRYAVNALADAGYRVRVACRRPDLAGFLLPLGNVGQIQLVQANLRYRWSIDRAMEGADTAVNLVGLLAEGGRQSFDGVQARGAGWVAEAAAAAGAGMVQVSAIGADEDSTANYARTKGEGERLVGEAAPKAIILRPSIIFGPEDDFFNRFASMARFSPILPLIGGGETRFQPVYVGDVAAAIVESVSGRITGGTVWELGGPEILTFRECMERMLSTIGRSRPLVSLPFGLAKVIGGFAQYLPGAPLTPDQVELLKSDNVVSDAMREKGRTLGDMGINPTAAGAILPHYLVRYRKHGQFEANRGL